VNTFFPRRLLSNISFSIIFIYLLGYLIQAIVLRNYGIQELNIFTFQYIEVGITFLLLTLIVTVIPTGCFLAYKFVREKANLPNYYLGSFGSSINTYHLFLVVAFFALFITQQDWNKYLSITSFSISLKEVFSYYVTLALPAVIILPILERKIVNRVNRKMYSLLIEPLRFTGVISAIIFDFILYTNFSWFRRFIYQSSGYFASSVVLFAIIFLVFYYNRKFYYVETRNIIPALGLIGSAIIFYVCINAYVVGTIRHIPFNRGGNLPISRAYLNVDDELLHSSLFKDNIHNKDTIGPFYIIEVNQDYLYVTKDIGQEWFNDWPPAFAIKKSLVNSIHYERIKKGGPRE
jgi:hypothetical protein